VVDKSSDKAKSFSPDSRRAGSLERKKFALSYMGQAGWENWFGGKWLYLKVLSPIPGHFGAQKGGTQGKDFSVGFL